MGSRRRVALALFVTFGLVAAGCGNEGDDDASESSDTTTAGTPDDENQFADLERIPQPDPCENDPGVGDGDIKVGTIAIESGPSAASFGPTLDGIRARIEKANQEGELGARTITLVTRDDTGDPTRNLEVARDLVEQENVFGVIETSNASGGSADYLAEQGIPVAGWHVGVPAWATHPNMFTFRQATADDPQSEYTSRNADLLADNGATAVALIGGSNQSSALFIERIRKSVEQLGEAEVVYENVAVPPAQQDFTAEVQAIKDSGADSIITSMDLLQNAALSDGLAKGGVTMKIIVFPGGYDPRVVNLPGMEGATFGLEFYPFELERPAFMEFDKWAPENVSRGQVPFIGWLSAEIFIQGIKEAGVECPTREAFIANLRLVDDYDGGGAFDPVDLSEDFGDEFRCVYYVRVEGGGFLPLYDGEAFCGEPITLE
jgi:ABC-type branched-subunit amino acid transport system substrate-binding protein